MLSKILRKKLHALTIILILSVFLIAATVFAAEVSEYITAKKGGTIGIADGVTLVIKPGALPEDALISAKVDVKKTRINYRFEANGGDVQLSKPARLYVSWDAIPDVEDTTLYGEKGEEIAPDKENKHGLVYSLDHFSLYYYRRR